jgi:hypothetical protein
MQKIHNLDDGVSEYFEFIVLGIQYRFRHLTTEETQELKDITEAESTKDKDKKSINFFSKFIEPVNPGSPPFSETAKKMLIPHWRRFTEMVKSEFSS